MRPLFLAPPALLLLWLPAALGGAAQDPLPRQRDGATQEDDERGRLPTKPPPPFAAFAESERARIEEEMQGAWMLADLLIPEMVLPTEDARGFATIVDGFLTITIQLRLFNRGILRNRVDYFIQGEVYRYQLEDFNRLQLASVMGFNNTGETGQLEFVGAREFKQFDLTLNEGEMELRSLDGRRLTFTKVEAGEFPDEALKFLRRSRSGLYDDPEVK